MSRSVKLDIDKYRTPGKGAGTWTTITKRKTGQEQPIVIASARLSGTAQHTSISGSVTPNARYMGDN